MFGFNNLEDGRTRQVWARMKIVVQKTKYGGWTSHICSASHRPRLRFKPLQYNGLSIHQTQVQQSANLWIRETAKTPNEKLSRVAGVTLRLPPHPLPPPRQPEGAEHSLYLLQSPQGLFCLSLIIHIQHTFTLSSEEHTHKRQKVLCSIPGECSSSSHLSAHS